MAPTSSSGRDRAGRTSAPRGRRPAMAARTRRRRRAMRGVAQLRLRTGFVFIAVVLSFFGARLVQLQGVSPEKYASLAASEGGTVTVELPAQRGRILDRDGKPLADSVDGRMVVADPSMTRAKAPQLARFLSRHLHVDYFATLAALQKQGSRFAYIARRVPASLALDVVDQARAAGFKGLDTRDDPVRSYPDHDVAANLIGFMGTDGPLAGLELAFNHQLAGTAGSETYEVGAGNRIPLGRSTVVPAHNGTDLHTTIDEDLQWYTQRILRQTVLGARGESGFAVVMDSHTGEILSLADYPTYDATNPQASPRKDRNSLAMTSPYEPGSVEKVLTLSSLIDAGKVTDRTRLVVPGQLQSGDRVIHDWFPHPTLKMTLAGVIAQSSNIGTAKASRLFAPGQLRSYLTRFGLGQRTDVGVTGETPGLLPSQAAWDGMTQDRVAFGQSVSVNGLQMAAAVNTIANGGVRVSPSLIQGSATNNVGQTVGTDGATTRRVVSKNAAHQMTDMMERVVNPDAGTAPGAQVPGYVVAGKTGTAQRVGPRCACYNGQFTVSFAGFAPADNPRFTVYVVVQNPRNGGGGGSVTGPAFSKIMGFALRRYGVPPTGAKPSEIPTTW
jgi:cell division protein FtsI (penicillin-binding protein 3)